MHPYLLGEDKFPDTFAQMVVRDETVRLGRFRSCYACPLSMDVGRCLYACLSSQECALPLTYKMRKKVPTLMSALQGYDAFVSYEESALGSIPHLAVLLKQRVELNKNRWFHGPIFKENPEARNKTSYLSLLDGCPVPAL